ncbi:cell surface glycoprotein MUC18 [Osmerus mordax]|uniref:cell surface glycoprotein MUC18 n=1 Tax=Osmerus mordax TaxID=8014 RepID=UPI0035100858
MKAFLLLTIVATVHILGCYAALMIQGPAQPVLEGEQVTLECLISESDLNISQVHFERYAKYMSKWYNLEPEGYFYRRCWQYDVDVSREDGRLLLYISQIYSYSQGPYRCVAENATASDNSSEPLSITVNYMRDISVHRTGFTRYFSSSMQDLRVPLGDDVEVECTATASETPDYYWQKEGEDWILPSSKLFLRKMRVEDGGAYTCVASHPTVPSLKKSRTISITVLPEDAPWYESTNGRLMLMTSAAGVAMLALILSMSVFLCRRTKQNTTRSSKGPIDDHSQKKPIYKASSESLPSTSGDKQPLV